MTCSLCWFSVGQKAAPEAREHGGDITEDGPWAIRFDTGTDGEGDGTGVT